MKIRLNYKSFIRTDNVIGSPDDEHKDPRNMLR